MKWICYFKVCYMQVVSGIDLIILVLVKNHGQNSYQLLHVTYMYLLM